MDYMTILFNKRKHLKIIILITEPEYESMRFFGPLVTFTNENQFTPS